MTVRLLSQGVYHTSVRANGSTDEHYPKNTPRDDGDNIILTCEFCDAVSILSKAVDNEQVREAKAAIARGKVTKPHPKGKQPDPLVFAVEDGNLVGVVTQDAATRIALRAKLTR